MAIKGIDVSTFQGEINWEKVKNDGIKFAILRAGYGMDIESQDDKYIERNISECERLGIPFGVYLFSYANTVAKASSEAEHTLRLVAGHKLPLGVWYDIEDNKTSGSVSKSTLTNIINKYCSIIEEAGYKVGIYANLNWLNNKIDSSLQDKYDVWVAQYNNTCDYKKDYIMWQYSSKGKVNGINGNVDMNYFYGKLEEGKPVEQPAKEEPKKHIIDVDGKWGKDTTKKAQEVFGTTVDGVVSNQRIEYKSKNPGLVESFEWESKPTGYSELIKAIQKKVGATQDGWIGTDTIKKMQAWLGTVQDGCVSNPSDVVRALQKWLNKQ